MKTIWMMGSAAAVAAVVAMVCGAQPARSSQDWLAKAQSEFATKARNAVIQRQIGKDVGGSYHSIAMSQFSSSVQPVSVETAPAQVPFLPAVEAPVAPLAAEPVNKLTLASAPAADSETRPMDTTSASFGKAVPEEPAIPEVQAVVPTVVTTDPVPAIAAQPVVAATPQLQLNTPAAAIVPVAASTPADRPVVTESPPRETARQKPRQVTKPSSSNHASRRSASGRSMEARGLEALRQRAPEIAAMVSRYM